MVEVAEVLRENHLAAYWEMTNQRDISRFISTSKSATSFIKRVPKKPILANSSMGTKVVYEINPSNVLIFLVPLDQYRVCLRPIHFPTLHVRNL